MYQFGVGIGLGGIGVQSGLPGTLVLLRPCTDQGHTSAPFFKNAKHDRPWLESSVYNQASWHAGLIVSKCCSSHVILTDFPIQK